MPAIRVHVRPPHRHDGLRRLGVIFGLICGLSFTRFMQHGAPIVEHLVGGPYYFLGVLFILIVFLMPLIILASFLARFCQHYKAIYWVGQISGSCYVIGILCSASVLERGPGEWWAYLIFLAVSIGGGIASGLICLLVTALHVHHISRLLVQDGTLCAICGYPVRRAGSACCPECGSPSCAATKPLGRVYAVGDWLARHSRKLACVLLPVAVIGVAAFLLHEIPRWRFQARFENPDYARRLGVYVPAGASFAASEHFELELCIGIERDADYRVLILQLHRSGYFDPGRIQLRIGSPAPGPIVRGKSRSFVQDLSPRIVCELNEEYTRQVLDSGVPATLVDALLAAADKASAVWSPGAARSTCKPDVVVSAQGHFSP